MKIATGAQISRFAHAGREYIVLGYPLRRPAAFAKLTAAELEVAEGIIEGSSSRELARRRNVSERTIANQLVSIYRKLRIASRAELAALVARSGRQ